MRRVKEVVMDVLDTALLIMWITSCLCSPYQAGTTMSLPVLQNTQILTPWPPVKILTFLDNWIEMNALIWYYNLQI